MRTPRPRDPSIANVSRKYLTTSEAARYCGYKGVWGIHQAVRRGHLAPAGWRGQSYTFSIESLDRFMRGPRPAGGRWGQKKQGKKRKDKGNVS